MDMMNVLYAVLVLGIMGAVFGLLLAIASKVFAVEMDPRVDAIMAVLPGANCGGCGFPGCGGCAKAIVEGTAPVNACNAGGPGVAAKIKAIMAAPVEGGAIAEVEVEEEEIAYRRMVAVVHCSGGLGVTRSNPNIKDCAEAAKVAVETGRCTFGCLGYGSCVAVCKFGAISIGPKGAAVVDPEKCTNCGSCRTACPRGIIGERPADSDILVLCSSNDRGAVAVKACPRSCIGCALCEKYCDYDAITVVNNIATIDYRKCASCGKCVDVCPHHAIHSISGKVWVDPELLG